MNQLYDELRGTEWMTSELLERFVGFGTFPNNAPNLSLARRVWDDLRDSVRPGPERIGCRCSGG